MWRNYCSKSTVNHRAIQKNVFALGQNKDVPSIYQGDVPDFSDDYVKELASLYMINGKN